ncbi:hypothetical protein ACLMAJ_00595 [Nocardia sp. KC 131]|uniref:hypothetical protein n=1 Tax=Nocardia arseniciresistens TaxID=3392119 RepID=UPI00398F34EB
MFELYCLPDDLAYSVAVLLTIFHEDTAHKLAIAPDNGPAILHHADGTLSRVDEDGWLASGA